ncbi:MAG: ATP phosphoribosyltransferase [Christensenellaceae bacterium]|nr:ATP phosphoribosyltransferase [Christensenellaceae bacterium]
MLNIALPKGRLGDDVYKLFSSFGYYCEGLGEDRRLVVESLESEVRYLLIKPSDVGIYVEHGAADIGVVGKDVILETNPNVYELMDLQLGKCRLAVAAPVNYYENPNNILRVATKYPNVAKNHYRTKNRDIEIIKLNGSIELAPILGLSDVIVDIVETGKTLEENNLEVVETIAYSSARLIANKAAYKFKEKQINDLLVKLMEAYNK